MVNGAVFDLLAIAFFLVLAAGVAGIIWVLNRIHHPRPVNREWSDFTGFWSK